MEAAKEAADWPVIAAAVFGKEDCGNGFTYRTHRTDRTVEVAGVSIDEMMKAAINAGADVIGAHCGVLLDITDYLAIAEQILASQHRPPQIPVIIQPNGSETGRPLGGDTGKVRSRALADAVPEFFDRGIRLLGGCCGTTPADIRAMAAAMRLHRRETRS